MSDNYGVDQKEVLQTENRSWSNPVALSSRPILTSEINLLGQISEEQGRASNKVNSPSGFLKKGGIRFSSSLSSLKSSAVSGEILTSEELTNSFFLASNGTDNLAMVNGWLLNISATATPNIEEHNLILLGSSDSYSSFTDFVFLEVWKQVVGYQDTIKKYGNQTSYASLPNDIYNNGVAVETSRRVQLMYRVRTESGFAIDLKTDPDGFNSNVFARGGASAMSTKNFTNMGPSGDPGLYRAGNGTDSDKELLGTVDGYVYAIPMFLVSRRVRKSNFVPSDFDPSSTLGMYNAGKKTDGNSFRPDKMFADVVYPSDIIDLRRKVATHELTPYAVAERTLRSIAKGTYSDTKGKIAIGTNGFDEAPGGSLLLRSDVLSSGPSSTMGEVKSDVPRRSFCNAWVEQKGNVKKILNTSWLQEGTNFYQEFSLAGYNTSTGSKALPSTSNMFVYTSAGWLTEGTHYSVSVSDATTHYTVKVTSIGTTAPTLTWYVKYDLTVTANGDYGFKDTPTKILEQRLGNVINAEENSPVTLYKRDSVYKSGDEIRMLGTRGKDISNIGQVAFLNATEDQSTLGYAFFYFTGMVLPQTGQQVLGVRSVQRVKTDGTLSDYLVGTAFDMYENRLEVRSIPTALAGETSALVVTFYLGTKTLRTSKDGKGVVETLEASFVDVSYKGVSTDYTFNTDSLGVGTDMKILVGTCGLLEGSVTKPTFAPYLLSQGLNSGDPFTSVRAPALASDKLLRPMLEKPATPSNGNTATKATWVHPDNNIRYNTNKIPVFAMSWVDQNDGEVVSVYQTRGYQGTLLDVARTVDVVCEGPALLTSSGSGYIDYVVLRVPTAVLTDTRTIRLYEKDVGRTMDQGQILVGDYFKVRESDLHGYRVSSVSLGSDTDGAYTEVTLYDVGISSDDTGVVADVVFLRLGVSSDMFINVVGNMPTRKKDDYLYASEYVSGDLSTIYAKPLSSVADALASNPNGVIVGHGPSSHRGKLDMVVAPVDGISYLAGEYGKVQTFYPPMDGGVFFKVFQSYVVKERASGKCYLAIVSSDTSTRSALTATPSTDPFTGVDVVDLFELEGRTLFKASV